MKKILSFFGFDQKPIKANPESFWARLYNETVSAPKALATVTHIAVLFVISIGGYYLYNNYICDTKKNVFKK